MCCKEALINPSTRTTQRDLTQVFQFRPQLQMAQRATLGVVAHTCNPITKEPATGGLLRFRGQPGLQE